MELRWIALEQTLGGRAAISEKAVVDALRRAQQSAHVETAVDRSEGQKEPGAPRQQGQSTGLIAPPQMEEANTDLENPLIKIAKVTLLREPEFLEGFMAGEILAGVELTDGPCQGRRRWV